MRFASSYSRPTLTPLGQRLLVLSERKLYDLDAPIGARESGTALFREVLIREAVRTAWSAIEDGREVESSLCPHSHSLGLEVIREEDEEREFSAKNEDRWFEDLLSDLGDGDEEGHCSIVGTVKMLPASEDRSDDAGVIEARFDHIEYILPTPASISPPFSLPITPVDESTHPYLLPFDDDDSLTLPPLLYRSWSSDSSGSDSDDCTTPTFDCAELRPIDGGSEWGKEFEEKDWECMTSGREVKGVRLRGF